LKCCDIEDGENYARTVKRHYRGALQMLDRAVSFWKAKDIDYLCNLGDVIDGQCSFRTDSSKELDSVLNKFNLLDSKVEKIHLIGNHELYNFTREELKNKLQTSRKGGHSNSNKEYYHIKPCKGWRIIVIDPYQISVIGLKENDKVWQKASKILMNGNPNMNPSVYNGGGSWYHNIDGLQRRFVPFNGGLGQPQIEWLTKQFIEAKEQDEKCILMSHVPLHPKSCDGVAMIWDFPDVVTCLQNAPSNVISVVLCGHDHKGGYYYDQDNKIHYITFQSPLNRGIDGECYGVIDFLNSKNNSTSNDIIIRGPNLEHFIHKKLLNHENTSILVNGDRNGEDCIRISSHNSQIKTK